jgi:hypothetical protein
MHSYRPTALKSHLKKKDRKLVVEAANLIYGLLNYVHFIYWQCRRLKLRYVK